MSPSFLKKGLKILGRGRGSEADKTKEDSDQKEGTVASTASSTTGNQTQSEHREDGSRTPVTDRNPSEGAGSDTARSLWDRAYGKLRDTDSGLVKKYEKLLSREWSKTGMYQVQGIRRYR